MMTGNYSGQKKSWMNNEEDKHCKQSKLNIHNLIFTARKKERGRDVCLLASYIPALRDERERNLYSKFVVHYCIIWINYRARSSWRRSEFQSALNFFRVSKKKTFSRYLGKRTYIRSLLIIIWSATHVWTTREAPSSLWEEETKTILMRDIEEKWHITTRFTLPRSESIGIWKFSRKIFGSRANYISIIVRRSQECR